MDDFMGDDLFDPRTLPPDEGMTEMALFPHPATRKVVQRFRRPMLVVAYEPMNAVAVAKQMIDVAVACGAQVTIEVPRRKISKEQRDVLVTRAMHVYRSMMEQHRAPKDVAQHVVDSILSAID